MIFLPVVERELRVSARKRSTYWVRVVAAGIAMVVGVCFLILARFTPAGGFAGPTSGSMLFAVLTWLSLIGSLSAGIFLTSDCLSEEKREGTMGLLFLTDLRGYDVVLGKLLATSLRAGCALLGVFPVLAITLLMGGVSVGEFWRTCLALATALLISLAAGLLVSAMSRVSQKALAATLSLLLGLAATGPLVDSLVARAANATFHPVLSHSSPVYLFMAAGTPAPAVFGTGLTINAAMVVALLGAAFVLLPRSWQQKTKAQPSARGGWMRRWKIGGDRSRELRLRLMDRNPALWLACRERRQAAVLWCFALFQVAAFVVAHFFGEMPAWMLWTYLSGFLSLLIYLGLASHAGRFFVETRQSGLIELMLATPLSSREIVSGQWRSRLRLFVLPLAICLVTHLMGRVLVQHMTYEQISLSATPVAGFPGIPVLGLALALAGADTLVVVADVVAIVWFGMWMGVTSRNTNQATLKTILYVQVIPWFVITFAAGMIIPLVLIPTLMGRANPPTGFVYWFPLLSTGLVTFLNVAADTWLVVWSRRKLYRELRERIGLKIGTARAT
jgi:ABC-type transport system involved in multi-copper enzyme maturation permease subunit